MERTLLKNAWNWDRRRTVIIFFKVEVKSSQNMRPFTHLVWKWCRLYKLGANFVFTLFFFQATWTLQSVNVRRPLTFIHKTPIHIMWSHQRLKSKKGPCSDWNTRITINTISTNILLLKKRSNTGENIIKNNNLTKCSTLQWYKQTESLLIF